MYSSYDEVMVIMPTHPGHWQDRFTSFSVSIRYLDIHGKEMEKILGPGETSCTLALPKIRNWPVIGVPYGDSFMLPPAGGFYSPEMNYSTEPILFLTWEHGFSASVLMDCSKQGFNTAQFNVPRFCSEVLKRSDMDPWKLDSGFIMNKLLSGDFRVTHIRTRPVTGITLFLDRGKWFFPSPFSPVYEMRAPGNFSIEQVPLGFHRLFHVQSKAWYEIFVTEQETITVLYK